jgi:hypothetical protein
MQEAEYTGGFSWVSCQDGETVRGLPPESGTANGESGLGFPHGLCEFVEEKRRWGVGAIQRLYGVLFFEDAEGFNPARADTQYQLFIARLQQNHPFTLPQ